jgi:hypothetical protein
VALKPRAIEVERDEAGLRSKRGDRGLRDLDHIRSEDQKSRPAVLDQAGDFRRGEAEVEGRERHPRLAGAEQEGEEMISVLRQIADPLLRLYARGD